MPSPLPAAAHDNAPRLADWLSCHRRIFVLTGAGCSTASGIPGYRGDDGQWTRPPPVTWQGFTGDPATYRRYWARSHVGWPRFDRARPNDAHHALAALGGGGPLSIVVTQNVDGLHQRAGSESVIDLHGRLDAVVCLGCGGRLPRASLQPRLDALNPGWSPGLATAAPDGDADIDMEAGRAYLPPHCVDCGGLLKPDVVFFGENVPRARYIAACDALEQADALLVAGSSLMVYSGFRFARMAHERGLPLAILNRGVTRADALAGLRLDGDLGATLSGAARLLGAAA